MCDAGIRIDIETALAVGPRYGFRIDELGSIDVRHRIHDTAIGPRENKTVGSTALHVEAFFVYQPMVETTQLQQIIETGLAAVGPVAYMVALDEVTGSAAGEHATSVP